VPVSISTEVIESLPFWLSSLPRDHFCAFDRWKHRKKEPYEKRWSVKLDASTDQFQLVKNDQRLTGNLNSRFWHRLVGRLCELFLRLVRFKRYGLRDGLRRDVFRTFHGVFSGRLRKRSLGPSEFHGRQTITPFESIVWLSAGYFEGILSCPAELKLRLVVEIDFS
jgi:hypothetical protein